MKMSLKKIAVCSTLALLALALPVVAGEKTT